MSTHNICFLGEISKILCGYPLLSVAMVHVSFRLVPTQWVLSSCATLKQQHIYLANCLLKRYLKFFTCLLIHISSEILFFGQIPKWCLLVLVLVKYSI